VEYRVTDLPALLGLMVKPRNLRPSCAASRICSTTNPGPVSPPRKLVSPRLTAALRLGGSGRQGNGWTAFNIATHKA
jgi:hypothetical protein